MGVPPKGSPRGFDQIKLGALQSVPNAFRPSLVTLEPLPSGKSLRIASKSALISSNSSDFNTPSNT